MKTDVLVLDVTWRPIDIISEKRAVTLCLSEKATAVVEHEDKVFRSQFLEVRVPKVISLKIYVPLAKSFTARITKKVLFARDGHTCQYCGTHKDLLPRGVKLTKDHVKPICKFEGNTRSERYRQADVWENVVTACEKCNQKKDNKLPYESGMYPLKTPVRPIGIAVTLIDKVDEEQFEFVRPFI